jgi:hypothetical protein
MRRVTLPRGQAFLMFDDGGTQLGQGLGYRHKKAR